MKRFLTLFTIILFVAFFTTGCNKEPEQPMDLYDSIQQRGKLVIGVRDNIKPFSFKTADGKYQGFEVDLAKNIAKAILNNEDAIEFIPVEPSDRISKLNSGQVDMIIATMTITPSRMRIVDFSKPYHIAGQTVLVPRNSKIKSITDINEQKIGVAFGTTAIEGIKVVAPGAMIAGYKTYNDAVKGLKNGEIDCFAADDTILIGYTLSDKSIRILSQKYTQEPYGIAFRKGNESTRTISIVNNVLDTLKANGTMNKLKAKWIK